MDSVVKGADPRCKNVHDSSIALDNPLDQDDCGVIETITSPKWQFFDLSHTGSTRP